MEDRETSWLPVLRLTHPTQVTLVSVDLFRVAGILTGNTENEDNVTVLTIIEERNNTSSPII